MLKGRPPKYKGRCSRCGGERNGNRRYCKPCEALLARERYARQRDELETLRARVEALGRIEGTGTGVTLPPGE